MLDTAAAAESSTRPHASQGHYADLPLHRVIADSTQPRRHFDDDALNELADSIRAHGVLQPITVKPKVGEIGQGDYDYVIVSGERRYRAAKLAGLEFVPAMVRPDLTMDRATVAVLQLVENLQRSDLTLWETAQGCAALVDAVGLEGAAKRLGYSKPWVSQRANVAGLPEAIRDLIERGLLTDVETAHNLHALADMDEQGADTVEGWLEDIANGLPPTREDVRRELREAREQHEATAARERARQQRAEEEAEAGAEVKATRDPLDLTSPDDDEDDAAPAEQKASTSAPRAESPYQREQRLREAAWTELMPDCKRLAREARKQVIDTLEAVAGDTPAGEHKFNLTISSPVTSQDAPAKPAGAKYPVELNGGTHDAGVVLEALDASHTVSIGLSVTVAQLRDIERLLGRSLRVHVPWGLAVHGTVLQAAAKRIAKAWSGKQAADAQHEADQAAIAAARAAASAPATVEANPAPPAAEATGDIAAFLAACTQRDAAARTKAGELHAAYVAWCGRTGATPVNITDHRWGRGIEAAGIEKKRSNGFVYIGLKFSVEADCE